MEAMETGWGKNMISACFGTAMKPNTFPAYYRPSIYQIDLFLLFSYKTNGFCIII